MIFKLIPLLPQLPQLPQLLKLLKHQETTALNYKLQEKG
jgi:hypothetical protein